MVIIEEKDCGSVNKIMNKKKSALILFQPSGKNGSFPVGTSILRCAQILGVDIDSVCGGRGICGRCQIDFVEGSFSKPSINSFSENISPLSEPEIRYMKKKGFENDRRLSCHAKLLGDVIIEVPQESQVHKQIIRKNAEVIPVSLDPVIRLHYLEVERPDLATTSGDYERLCEALKSQWNIICQFSIRLNKLRDLQETLRKGHWNVTVAVYQKQKIVSIWPNFHDKLFGVAVDIGTTTIAAHLCDLSTGEVLSQEGIMNPQIRYGEDLMSRVAFVMMNPESLEKITHTVRTGVDGLIKKMCLQLNIDKKYVLAATVVCNPIMHHFFLRIDPTELGTAPFALATNESVTLSASELSIKHMNPEASIYMLPCIAGHVGSDAAAVLLAESPHLSKKMTLIVDVGTNAEIILGNSNRLLAASSPTGPAFEGAQISCGQRASIGAIEQIRIDPVTFEPIYKLIGSNQWSNDTVFAKKQTHPVATGICGSGIIEAIAEMYLKGLLSRDGNISEEHAKKTKRIQKDGRTYRFLIQDGINKIYISQKDIRAIQLAKAALYAGIKLLMEKMKIKSVDRIVLAGAFGSNINSKYAMILGMIPDCDLDSVKIAGNAASTGARITLLSQSARQSVENLVRKIEKVETAIEPNFQKHFIEAMSIPHKTDTFDNLRQHTRLPNQDEPRSKRRTRISR